MDVTLLLLANSRKKGGRCLAGLRTDDYTWVRPVSGTPDHEIPEVHTRIPGGVFRPLDIVRCALMSADALPHQSENWRVVSSRLTHIRRASFEEVAGHLARASEDSPYFLDSPQKSVSETYFRGKTNPSPSLALIHVSSVTITTEARKEGQSDRRRAIFSYRNQAWDLPMTDDWFPLTGARHDVGEAYLCISVGDVYPSTNAHYKLVAGIVPVPTLSVASASGPKGTVSQLFLLLFGSKPTFRPARFSSSGWFIQTAVKVTCPECAAGQLHVFRKHYLNNQRIAHYWAIACSGCRVVKELADYASQTRLAIRSAARAGGSLGEMCEGCAT